MVTVTVIKGFRDIQVHVDRKPGERFDATEERVKQIEAKLPGYISYTTNELKSGYDDMSVDDLRALCKERGIKVPPRAGKAKLVSLLEG